MQYSSRGGGIAGEEFRRPAKGLQLLHCLALAVVDHLSVVLMQGKCFSGEKQVIISMLTGEASVHGLEMSFLISHLAFFAIGIQQLRSLYYGGLL